MSMNWEGKIKDENRGQAPMFTGNLIQSLLTTTEIVANRVKMEELLMDDPFVWAPACHQMYRR